MPRKFIRADAPYRSINLQDGESLRHAVSASANVGNAWTVAVWAKPSGSFSPARGLFSIEHELTLSSPTNFPFSNILITFITSGTNNMRAQTWAGLGAPIKDFTYNSWWTQDVWIHTVITWNGTSLLAYKNAVAVSPDTIVFNNAGSMGTPPARYIGVGTRVITASTADAFRGPIHSAALWSVALSDSAIAEIYNGGYGAKFDLLTNRGNYTSAASLQHYWRPGHYWPPDAAIGTDYGVATTNRRNVMTNAFDVGEDDIVHDWPGAGLV